MITALMMSTGFGDDSQFVNQIQQRVVEQLERVDNLLHILQALYSSNKLPQEQICEFLRFKQKATQSKLAYQSISQPCIDNNLYDLPFQLAEEAILLAANIDAALGGESPLTS